MRNGPKVLVMLMILGLGASGCTYSRFTNLTPTRLPRDASGNYPVEMTWDSNNRNIVDDSVRAYVVVEKDFYPMTPTPVVEDRWEAMIPVRPGANYVNYHFKIDFKYRGLPNKRPNSDLSEPFVLQIVDDTFGRPIDPSTVD
jgi:hypothetical protein